MDKFKLGADEVVLKKAGGTYWPPETRDMGALKAAFNAKQCKFFLTGTRLAACTKVAGFPAGPLIWLIMWLVGRKIYAQVLLEKVAKVEKAEKSQQLVITLDDGSDFVISFDSFFDSRDQWLEAVADAIGKADPDARIQRSGDTVEISRG